MYALLTVTECKWAILSKVKYMRTSTPAYSKLVFIFALDFNGNWPLHILNSNASIWYALVHCCYCATVASTTLCKYQLEYTMAGRHLSKCSTHLSTNKCCTLRKYIKTFQLLTSFSVFLHQLYEVVHSFRSFQASTHLSPLIAFCVRRAVCPVCVCKAFKYYAL